MPQLLKALAFSGPAGSGKSTLIRYLESKLQCPFVIQHGTTREFFASVNQTEATMALLSEAERVDLQLANFKFYLGKLRNTINTLPSECALLLCDRTIADYLGYVMAYGGSRISLQQFSDLIAEIAEFYSSTNLERTVFWTHVNLGFPTWPVADGFRRVDWAKELWVHSISRFVTDTLIRSHVGHSSHDLSQAAQRPNSVSVNGLTQSEALNFVLNLFSEEDLQDDYPQH